MNEISEYIFIHFISNLAAIILNEHNFISMREWVKHAIMPFHHYHPPPHYHHVHNAKPLFWQSSVFLPYSAKAFLFSNSSTKTSTSKYLNSAFPFPFSFSHTQSTGAEQLELQPQHPPKTPNGRNQIKWNCRKPFVLTSNISSHRSVSPARKNTLILIVNMGKAFHFHVHIHTNTLPHLYPLQEQRQSS